MRTPRRRRLLWTAFTALALLALVLWLRPAPEPRYQGQTLDEWLESYPAGLNRDREHFHQAVVALGSNSIPFYVRELAAEDNFVARRFWAGVEARGWTRRHHWEAGARQFYASIYFHLMGAQGAPAAPEILRLLRDPKLTPDARCWVAAALGGIGPAAAPAVPDLARLLDTCPDPDIRFRVAWALGQIAAQPAVAVPALCRALEAQETQVLANAASALGAYGTNAVAALPRLRTLAAAPATNAPAESGGPRALRNAAQKAMRQIETAPVPPP